MRRDFFKTRRPIRFVLAVLLAPAIGFVAPILTVYLTSAFQGIPSGIKLDYFVTMALMGLQIGLPIMVIVGLPLHFALTKLRWQGMTIYAFAGFLMSVISVAAFVGFNLSRFVDVSIPPEQSFGVAAIVLIPGSSIGALTGLAFYVIRGRSGGDAPTRPSGRLYVDWQANH